jgi:hypothetical protein
MLIFSLRNSIRKLMLKTFGNIINLVKQTLFLSVRRSGNSLRENPEFAKVGVKLDLISKSNTYNSQE